MKKDTTRKPFFARLLEEQELEQVSGGAPDKTMKHPSDGDDHDATFSTPKDATMKHPSDGDDHTV